MKITLRLLLAFVMLFAMTSYVSAQEVVDKKAEKAAKRQQKEMDKRQKKKEKEAAKHERIDTRKSATYETTVYMFGVSGEFGDSVVYLTGVQEVPEASLTKKYDYLYGRTDYSFQYTQYLGAAFDVRNQTTSVFFELNKKKANKRYAKVQKKYESSKGLKKVYVSEDQFRFVPSRKGNQ